MRRWRRSPCRCDVVSDVCSLVLRNERAELARMVVWINCVVARFGLSAETAHALHLCLEEAVVNVVSYAFEPGSVHDVRVELWRDGEGVHAAVTDDGRAFDPLSRAAPDVPTDVESAPVGGLGIMLMRRFAGDVVYRRVDGSNRLTLRFPG